MARMVDIYRRLSPDLANRIGTPQSEADTARNDSGPFQLLPVESC
jgi:hypothetical protein